jgi:hypothetical protein
MTRSPAAWLLSIIVVGLAALAPTASAAQINPAVQLTALSCASTGNCTAVGTYDDGLAESQALLVTETNGMWQQAVKAQPPVDAALGPFKASNGGGLADVSCPSAGDCVAVGRYTGSGNIDHAVLFAETHGRWARGTRVQLPANATRPTKPKSGVVDDLRLAAVSCSSVGDCVAVGNYETNAEVWEGLILTETDGHWSSPIEAPLPARAPIAGQDAVLLAVTCRATGACTAAGKYVDAAGHQQGLLISSSGGTWAAVPAPTPPNDANVDPSIVPSSLACADADDCAAVGTYINPLQNSLGLLFSETGGVWGDGTGATLPADAAPSGTVGDQTVVLASVACPQAGDCTAVGWYFDNDENGQGLLVDEDGGTWQPGVEVTLPANAVQGLEKQSAGLDSIACPAIGNCLATGVYTDGGYNSQGLLLSEVGGVWRTGLESPLPPNAGSIQYATADQSVCTGVGDCTVIGQYNDRRGDVLGYTISESNGSWLKPVEIALPSATISEVKLSLSLLLAPTGKQASLARVRRARGFVFEYPAVETGTAYAYWFARRNGHLVLIATGRLHARSAGVDQLKLKLTHVGVTLLTGARRVRIATYARFMPAGKQRAQQAVGVFTLR